MIVIIIEYRERHLFAIRLTKYCAVTARESRRLWIPPQSLGKKRHAARGDKAQQPLPSGHTGYA
ncbi:hypothetical protein, partial [Alcanivorax sp. HI0007]|uniref:hypothetical protein n=1 Tax=Alcanivorax sp. HI0007 TaxID=1822218 RepID=UPI001E37259A